MYIIVLPNYLPVKGSSKSACFDIKARIEKTIELLPGERLLIPTGIWSHGDANEFIDIRPRSGLAWKNGVTILNSPGTIDADYTDEIKIILYNSDKETTFIIEPNMRIAQMRIISDKPTVFVINANPKKEIDKLSKNKKRGGFGSTGLHNTFKALKDIDTVLIDNNDIIEDENISDDMNNKIDNTEEDDL